MTLVNSKSKFTLGLIYYGLEKEEYALNFLIFHFDPLGGSNLMLVHCYSHKFRRSKLPLR